MSTAYIPPTDSVRRAYGWSGHDSHVPANREYKEAEFDRWLAAHDAEIIAQAELRSQITTLSVREQELQIELGSVRDARDQLQIERMKRKVS